MDDQRRGRQLLEWEPVRFGVRGPLGIERRTRVFRKVAPADDDYPRLLPSGRLHRAEDAGRHLRAVLFTDVVSRPSSLERWAMSAGAACSRRNAHHPSAPVFGGGRESTRPATGSSPSSTGPPTRCDAPRTPGSTGAGSRHPRRRSRGRGGACRPRGARDRRAHRCACDGPGGRVGGPGDRDRERPRGRCALRSPWRTPRARVCPGPGRSTT